MDGIVFSDMSRCEPASALGRELKHGQWRLVDYQVEEFKGTMMFAGEETRAPQVRLKLGLEGLHALYLGIDASAFSTIRARVKLSADPCFQELERQECHPLALEEVYFKHADLTGQDLVIEQRPHEPGQINALAYLRCVALSKEQAQALRADRKRTDTRTLAVYNDGVGIFSDISPRTEEEIWEAIEPFRDSDAKIFVWGISTDHCFHPSRIGAVHGKDTDAFLTKGDRLAADSVRALLEKDINPIKSAGAYAHRIGLEFHIYYRMQNFTCMPPYDQQMDQRLLGKNPQWRCVHRDGRPLVHMSYAYEEVRQFVVSMLEEAAQWEADGMVLMYKRGAPFVMYEPPLVEGFKAQYGQDPREIDEFDERWLQYRCAPLTLFMRQVRQALDRVGHAAGKRLAVTACSFATEAENLYYGLDLPLWIKEGLVDYLAPMGIVHGCPEVDLSYYVRLVEGSPCRFYPMLPVLPGYVRFHTPELCLQSAREYFAGGAHGLSVWDCPTRPAVWGPVLKQIGHRARDDPAGSPPQSHHVHLQTLGHVDFRDGHIPADYQRIGKEWSLNYVWHAH